MTLKRSITLFFTRRRRFDTCPVCLGRVRSRRFGCIGRRRSRQLDCCGRTFHADCVERALDATSDRTCPVCREPTDVEDPMTALRRAVLNGNDPLIDDLLLRHDPLPVVRRFVVERNTDAVNRLKRAKHLNWHATVDGMTLRETFIKYSLLID